jgi:hypothetical protein
MLYAPEKLEQLNFRFSVTILDLNPGCTSAAWAENFAKGQLRYGMSMTTEGAPLRHPGWEDRIAIVNKTHRVHGLSESIENPKNQTSE